ETAESCGQVGACVIRRHVLRLQGKAPSRERRCTTRDAVHVGKLVGNASRLFCQAPQVFKLPLLFRRGRRSIGKASGKLRHDDGLPELLLSCSKRRNASTSQVCSCLSRRNVCPKQRWVYAHSGQLRTDNIRLTAKLVTGLPCDS